MSSLSSDTTSIQDVISYALDRRISLPVQEIDPTLVAVVTFEKDVTYLPDTVAAVLSQSLLPGTLVFADCSGATKEPLYSQLTFDQPQGADSEDQPKPRTMQVEVVSAHGAKSFADAVRKALGYAKIPVATRALWLLHDDSRPLNTRCLEFLAETWKDAPTASLLGCKQMDWDGVGLHNVGYYSAQGQLVSLVVDGEPDQEQYDTRSDVFAVSLSGALVPMSTIRSVSGLGTWASTFGQSADLSRRVSLSGGRVVVVPSARIGHRRARYEGMRSKSGLATTEQGPRDSTMQVVDARERYYFSNHRVLVWPLLWLWRLLCVLWFAVLQLLSKQPYAAACELLSPWHLVRQLPAVLTSRRHLSAVSETSIGKLGPLQASRQQVKQWRLRTQAYDDQLNHPLVSTLARSHLRQQLRIRSLWASAMVALVAVFTIVHSWSVVQALFSGSTLHSDYLLGTAASFEQLVRAATVPYTWGLGLGTQAAPTPFLLVLTLASVLTGGRVSLAVALLFFACLPVAALSFWALAGIFTRSNLIRVLSGLLWVALAFALPIYSAGDLPAIVVMAFLPAAFAFTFRAVGMYHTEEPAQPHPSARSAACAAICFTLVVLAEPQLLLALVVVFVLFICLVVSHRTMLIMIPLPAALAMAPTLVNSVWHINRGAWRQLFSDILLASPRRFGSPQSGSVVDLFSTILGLRSVDSEHAWIAGSHPWRLALAIALAVLVLIALAALAISSIARISRLMWFLALVGAALAVTSSCVAVGHESLPAAGSPLPGLLLTLVGLLSCVCMMAGGAVRPFEQMNVQRQSNYHAYTDSELPDQYGPEEAQEDYSHGSLLAFPSSAYGRQIVVPAAEQAQEAGSGWSGATIVRSILAVVLVCILAVLGLNGWKSQEQSSLTADKRGLPMVAVDYLSQSANRRVLAVYAHSSTDVGFTAMRTARGDLIDVSASAAALRQGGLLTQSDEELSAAVAKLTASSDGEAIDTISRLGFGGIYVPTGGQAVAAGLDSSTPNDALVANITGSDGTQQVVANPSGTYFRLTDLGVDQQGISLADESAAQNLWWRPVWLWTMAIVFAAYCLVALPRWRVGEGRFV